MNVGVGVGVDIFDPEIIYCVNKIVIEPFINLNFDISIDRSTRKRFLCISFEEELMIDIENTSRNFIMKNGKTISGGSFVVVHNHGGEIYLLNPLTSLSSFYYCFIYSLSDTPEFKPIIVDYKEDETRNRCIYISSIEEVCYTGMNEPIIHLIPKIRWSPTKQIYPQHLKRELNNNLIRIQNDFLNSPSPEYMSDSLPSIVNIEIDEERIDGRQRSPHSQHSQHSQHSPFKSSSSLQSCVVTLDEPKQSKFKCLDCCSIFRKIKERYTSSNLSHKTNPSETNPSETNPNTKITPIYHPDGLPFSTIDLP